MRLRLLNAMRKFQSLSRDSVCLDKRQAAGTAKAGAVSIPESGFCLFGPPQHQGDRPSPREFQSLSRDSVCLDLLSLAVVWVALAGFNP